MIEEVIATREVSGGRIEVVIGDLTEQRVDAIVNAANSALAHGGGVAGAIVRKGGAEIQEESDLQRPVRVGGAVVTGAGRLPCRRVIHAVGPRWGEGDEATKLRDAVESSLQRAEEYGIESLALPAISTGIFGYPKAAGCGVIVRTVVGHLKGPNRSVRRVRLVSLDRETAECFALALTTE